MMMKAAALVGLAQVAAAGRPTRLQRAQLQKSAPHARKAAPTALQLKVTNCFQMQGFLDVNDMPSSPPVLPDGEYVADFSKLLHGEPTYWRGTEAFVHWCPGGGAPAAYIFESHYEGASAVDNYQAKVLDGNCDGWMETVPNLPVPTSANMFGEGTWTHVGLLNVQAGVTQSCRAAKLSVQVQGFSTVVGSDALRPEVVQGGGVAGRRGATKALAHEPIPWLPDTSLVNIPDRLSGYIMYVISSDKVVPPSTSISIQCAAPFCDVQILIHNNGSATADTQGGLPISLPPDWMPGSCAPKFIVGGNTACEHGMVAWRRTLNENQEVSVDLDLDPAMYMLILGRPFVPCTVRGPTVDECENDQVGPSCKLIADQCYDNFCGVLRNGPTVGTPGGSPGGSPGSPSTPGGPAAPSTPGGTPNSPTTPSNPAPECPALDLSF